MAKGNFFKHWPTMLLGLIVAVVLLTAVFSFQLNQTEVAVVTTFGRPAVVSEPGLHFRWPFPFQKVYLFDKRIRCFEGSSGKLEETTTSDKNNILVGIYVDYRISDPKLFFEQLIDVKNAEEQLNNLMRSAKNNAFGQSTFNQIVNVNDAQRKLNAILADIKKNLASQMSKYGVEIVDVGINSLGVPQNITEEVFNRMIAECEKTAEEHLQKGEKDAKKITDDATAEASKVIAKAQAEAEKTRAKGEANAVKYYEVFKADPELAEFLRKLSALEKIVQGRTTLVLDTNVAPFDLLNAAPKSTTLPVVPGNKR